METTPKLLIVEDDADQRELLVEMLSMRGWEVAAVESAEAALEAARGTMPEVVLTDLRLGGMTGAQLAQKLRATGGRPPVLLCMTGLSGVRDRLGQAGFDAVFVKPSDSAEIDRHARALLGSRKPAEAPMAVT